MRAATPIFSALLFTTVALLTPGPAAADKADKRPKAVRDVEDRWLQLQQGDSGDDGGAAMKAPGFGFTAEGLADKPSIDVLGSDLELATIDPKSTVVAVAADGKAAWIATNLEEDDICGDETCPRHPKPSNWDHVTALFDGTGYQPLVFHVGKTITGKAQAAAMKSGVDYDAVPGAKPPAGAADAVKVFESTIGDPKVLAATISTRKDVVLYGSELKERVIGGKKVAATLTKWNLSFKVRDGLRAGVTTSGTVAWVAANLDATSMKKKGGKPTPYRALFIYEKTSGWQLVQIHFSFTPW